MQAFDWNSMRTFHRLLPWVPIGLLGTPTAEQLPKLRRFADQINPPHRDATPQYVARVHQHRMEVFTWTVDAPDDMRRVIAAGVDGVITNRPDVLDEVIDQGADDKAA